MKHSIALFGQVNPCAAAPAAGVVWFQYQRSKALLKRFKGEVHFTVGRYVVGLEGSNGSVNNVQCVITPKDFVFATMGARELGRVPRNSVEEVMMDDKSQITQRLTLTRMVTLGVFSLAAPKRKKIKEWCVAVHSKDSKGLNRAAVFEFVGSAPERDANRAANLLMKYILRNDQDGQQDVTRTAVAPSNDTMLCPFCAETIKAAAVLCRFCNRDLPVTISTPELQAKN